MALNFDEAPHGGNGLVSGNTRDAQRHLILGALECSLGKVIDLSQFGALVVTRTAPPQGVIPFQVGDGHGAVSCGATIAWSRRCGLFRHEVGVMFPALTKEQGATITRLIEGYGLSSDYGARREAA